MEEVTYPHLRDDEDDPGQQLLGQAGTLHPSTIAASPQNQPPRQVIGKYELGKVLAAGDFDCRTRLCSHIVTGAQYVVRIYHKSVLSESGWMWERVRESIHVQRTLPKHDNIVEMVECFETASNLYILMQLFQSGNVSSIFTANSPNTTGETGEMIGPDATSPLHLSRPRRHPSSLSSSSYSLSQSGMDILSQSDLIETTSGAVGGTNAIAMGAFITNVRSFTTMSAIRDIFTQIVRGTQHMHVHHVVHTGIAPDHILINDRGLVKISNLVSCCFCAPGTKVMDLRGTRHTVAPEVLKGEPYDPYLADSWALGVVLYFMLNGGRYPHDGANTLQHIMYHHVRPVRANVPTIAKDLLARLLQVSPSQRLTVDGILCHPFCRLAEEGGGCVAGAMGGGHGVDGAASSTGEPPSTHTFHHAQDASASRSIGASSLKNGRMFGSMRAGSQHHLGEAAAMGIAGSSAERAERPSFASPIITTPTESPTDDTQPPQPQTQQLSESIHVEGPSMPGLYTSDATDFPWDALTAPSPPKAELVGGVSLQDMAAFFIQHTFHIYTLRKQFAQVTHLLNTDAMSVGITNSPNAHARTAATSEVGASAYRASVSSAATPSTSPLQLSRVASLNATARSATNNNMGRKRESIMSRSISTSNVFSRDETTASRQGLASASATGAFLPAIYSKAGSIVRPDGMAISVVDESSLHPPRTDSSGEHLHELGPVGAYEVCPLCQRLPNVGRQISAKPYLDTHFEYIGGEYRRKEVVE